MRRSIIPKQLHDCKDTDVILMKEKKTLSTYRSISELLQCQDKQYKHINTRVCL